MLKKLFLALLVSLLVTPAWAAPPAVARIYRTSDLTISNNTQTEVPYPLVTVDQGPFQTNSSATGRLYTSTHGYYLLTANVWFDVNAQGIRTIQIRQDGTRILGYCGWQPAFVVEPKQCVASWYQPDDATHFYSVYVYQSSGADMLLKGDASGTTGVAWFSLVWLF